MIVLLSSFPEWLRISSVVVAVCLFVRLRGTSSLSADLKTLVQVENISHFFSLKGLKGSCF